MKCGCSICIFVLNSANLICRGTDISKYVREFTGLRDDEGRQYYGNGIAYMPLDERECPDKYISFFSMKSCVVGK